MACGSRDIRDIVSACTVWFTFVFRTPTPRAVEDFIVEVLHDSRGSTLALRLPRIPHLYPYCITTWAVCQEKNVLFCKVFTGLSSYRLIADPLHDSHHFPLTPLLYHNLDGLSRTFFKILNFFELPSECFPCGRLLHYVRGL